MFFSSVYAVVVGDAVVDFNVDTRTDLKAWAQNEYHQADKQEEKSRIDIIEIFVAVLSWMLRWNMC